MIWMRTTFSNELNENDFFSWVDWIDWERLFRLSWMRTTFSTELNENDFVDWIEWKRLFRLRWMKRLFRLSWMKITFLNKLNENVFFQWKRFVLVSKHSASYARYQLAELLAIFFPDLVSECQCIRRMVSTYPEGGVNVSTGGVSLSIP
jgi:beta-xylosidase